MIRIQTSFRLYLLVVLVAHGCAPVDEADHSVWVFQEDEGTAAGDETPEPEQASSPQIPVVDYTRDCPAFDPDPGEFDFELYRYLACHRDPDQSVLFSPALARIALAEAAEGASQQEAEEIASFFGFERLQDLRSEVDHLREVLLSLRPHGAELYDSTGLSEYEISETDQDTLQRALGLEFYTAECDELECSWSAQNDRWIHQNFHFNPPERAVTRNTTRSVIFRGQTETILSVDHPNRRVDFELPDGSTIDYPRRMFVTNYFGHTDTANVVVWRPVGGQLSFIVLMPQRETSLETIEEGISREALTQWLSAAQGSALYMVLDIPPFDIEETADLSGLTSSNASNDLLAITTRLALHREGLNRPEPVELEFPEGGIALGAVSGRHYGQVTSPVLFLLYHHDLDTIILMGRLARPH